MIKLLLSAALLAGTPQMDNLPNVPFERSESDQRLHLDVQSPEEARSIRLAVLSGWSHGPEDDVTIEPMVDAKGRRFFCVKVVR